MSSRPSGRSRARRRSSSGMATAKVAVDARDLGRSDGRAALAVHHEPPVFTHDGGRAKYARQLAHDVAFSTEDPCRAELDWHVKAVIGVYAATNARCASRTSTDASPARATASAKPAAPAPTMMTRSRAPKIVRPAKSARGRDAIHRCAPMATWRRPFLDRISPVLHRFFCFASPTPDPGEIFTR